MTTYAPGMPAWVDLSSPDPASSARFYRELFGWTSREAEEPEAGGYTTFYSVGKAVAAVGPMQSGEQPPVWTSYFATDDADEVARRAGEAGGTVVTPPIDVMGYGRMTILADPSGAVFAVWQAGSMPGAEVTGEPGSLRWNELMTRDPAGAKPFYGSVLGWSHRDIPNRSGTYTIWQVADRPAGGMMPMEGDTWPAELPPHWMVYFAVADTDATAAKAAELGGSVSVPPTDTPAGRLAVLGDPHGAFFSIIKPDPSFQP
jgi:hypothetical protein